jgi:hypothetical protein
MKMGACKIKLSSSCISWICSAQLYQKHSFSFLRIVGLIHGFITYLPLSQSRFLFLFFRVLTNILPLPLEIWLVTYLDVLVACSDPRGIQNNRRDRKERIDLKWGSGATGRPRDKRIPMWAASGA